MSHSRHIVALLLGASISLAACNNNDPACDDFPTTCNTVEPLSGSLTINLSPDGENQAIPIAVYNGYIEDNALYFVDTIRSANITYDVPFGRYSASATYRRGTQTITAIDGARVRVRSNRECDYTCYTVDGGNINLKLK
jgi:hypothetical protein